MIKASHQQYIGSCLCGFDVFIQKEDNNTNIVTATVFSKNWKKEYDDDPENMIWCHKASFTPKDVVILINNANYNSLFDKMGIQKISSDVDLTDYKTI